MARQIDREAVDQPVLENLSTMAVLLREREPHEYCLVCGEA
jgi:hypothetical protein